MTEYGWDADDWLALRRTIEVAVSLVVSTLILLGEKPPARAARLYSW
jgi:hypothetical protein